MSSHVSEGLRTVLLDPGSGFGFARDGDVFALVVAVVVAVVGLVVVVVNVHERNYLRHDDNFMVLLDLGAVFLFLSVTKRECVCVCVRARDSEKAGFFWPIQH